MKGIGSLDCQGLSDLHLPPKRTFSFWDDTYQGKDWPSTSELGRWWSQVTQGCFLMLAETMVDLSRHLVSVIS